MTHEAINSAVSPLQSNTSAQAQQGLDVQHSSPNPSHGHTHKADDAFLLTLRPLLNLYESPTSPAWGYRK